jgi:hypothetical protein
LVNYKVKKQLWSAFRKVFPNGVFEGASGTDERFLNDPIAYNVSLLRNKSIKYLDNQIKGVEKQSKMVYRSKSYKKLKETLEKKLNKK